MPKAKNNKLNFCSYYLVLRIIKKTFCHQLMLIDAKFPQQCFFAFIEKFFSFSKCFTFFNFYAEKKKNNIILESLHKS